MSHEHEPWRSTYLGNRRDLDAQHSDRAILVTPLATDVTVGTSTNEDDISSTGALSGRLNGDRINSNDQVAVKFAIAGHGTAPDISVPSDGARTASPKTMPPARARRRQESTRTIDQETLRSGGKTTRACALFWRRRSLTQEPDKQLTALCSHRQRRTVQRFLRVSFTPALSQQRRRCLDRAHRHRRNKAYTAGAVNTLRRRAQ